MPRQQRGEGREAAEVTEDEDLCMRRDAHGRLDELPVLRTTGGRGGPGRSPTTGHPAGTRNPNWGDIKALVEPFVTP